MIDTKWPRAGMRPRASGCAEWFLFAAILVAVALVLANPNRSAAESPQCIVPSDVPAEAATKWCISVKRNGVGRTYAGIAMDQRVAGRFCEALRLAKRGAELGSEFGYVVMGDVKLRGECEPRDIPAAIAAFEEAMKLRDHVASSRLTQIYEGRFGQEYRDLEKAIMWRWADYLIHAYPDEGLERNYGRRLGLSDAQIDEGRERMRRWLVERKVVMRPRCGDRPCP